MARNPWILFFVSLVKVKKLRSLVRKLTRKIGKKQPDGFEAAVPRTIPHNIWMFWDKGIDEAPEVVKMCIASWQEKPRIGRYVFSIGIRSRISSIYLRCRQKCRFNPIPTSSVSSC